MDENRNVNLSRLPAKQCLILIRHHYLKLLGAVALGIILALPLYQKWGKQWVGEINIEFTNNDYAYYVQYSSVIQALNPIFSTATSTTVRSKDISITYRDFDKEALLKRLSGTESRIKRTINEAFVTHKMALFSNLSACFNSGLEPSVEKGCALLAIDEFYKSATGSKTEALVFASWKITTSSPDQVRHAISLPLLMAICSMLLALGCIWVLLILSANDNDSDSATLK